MDGITSEITSKIEIEGIGNRLREIGEFENRDVSSWEFDGNTWVNKKKLYNWSIEGSFDKISNGITCWMSDSVSNGFNDEIFEIMSKRRNNVIISKGLM